MKDFANPESIKEDFNEFEGLFKMRGKISRLAEVFFIFFHFIVRVVWRR